MNMEHFMTRLPGNDFHKKQVFSEIYGKEEAAVFFDNYLYNFITEKDFEFLKETGVNLLRLPFTYRHFEDDLYPGEYKESGFKHLDRVLELCQEYNIFAILDLHAAPGGQNPDFHADSDLGVSYFWYDVSLQNRVIKLWRFIADHYKDNPWLAGYDIINEPVNVPDADIFNNFFDRAIEAIREVDSKHILFLEGDHWAQDFSMLDNPCDPQLAYSFHYYPSFALNNGLFDTQAEEKIRNGLEPIINRLKEKFRRPLWCGETGMRYSRNMIERARDIVKITLDILEEHDVSWTLWTYKDTQAMGLVFPGDDTPWMKMVSKSNWDLFKEQEQAQEVFSLLEEKGYFKPIPEELRYKLQFRLRGLFQQLYIEQILKPILREIPWQEMKDYPVSFNWDNCDYYKEIAVLVKTYTSKK